MLQLVFTDGHCDAIETVVSKRQQINPWQGMT